MVEITGKNVVLREATKEDIDELYYWQFVEEKQEAKKWNAPYINEAAISKEEYLENWMRNYEILPDIPNTLVITVDGKLIGNVGCYWVDRSADWLETGIVIYDPQYWDGGYGTEAYKLWIDFLFYYTHLHRVGMSTWSGNERMMRVAEKAGMKEEARVREARTVDGEYFDSIKMGILREEWEVLKEEEENRP